MELPKKKRSSVILLAIVFFGTTKATTFHSESENQCRLHTTTELRCDGNKGDDIFPVTNENIPFGTGKAGPKGQPGPKGEPGESCTAQECLKNTAEFEEMFERLSSCDIEEIENASHNASSIIRHNHLVTYQCDSGFFTENVSTRKCVMGKLLPSFALYPFKCQRGCLVTSINRSSSSVPQGTYAKSDSSISYSCDAGYTTRDLLQRTCNGSDITPSFEEEPLDCYADCTAVNHKFDKGTVQLPMVHGEKAEITCDNGYILKNGSNTYCRDGLVDLSNVVCKKPTYFYVKKSLSWLSAQKHCEDTYSGNLASIGLETLAARRKLILDFNVKTGLSIGFRKVSSKWIRADGSVVEPPLDFQWVSGYSGNHNYMKVSTNPYQNRIGRLWDTDENYAVPFFCEN